MAGTLPPLQSRALADTGNRYAPSHAEQSPRSLLWNVQILRFVAAGMVLIEHLELELLRGHHSMVAAVADPTHIPWRAGVDLFFVVSGFIMYYMTADSFGQPGYASDFLKRRIIRVVPLYWIFTGLMIVAILTTRQVNRSGLNPIHVLASLFFIPMKDPAGMTLPVLAPGWTLNFEVFFYLSFATVLRIPVRKALLWLTVFFILLIVFGKLFSAQISGFGISSWANPMILEFLYGIGIAHLFRRRVSLHGWRRFGLIVLGIGLLIVGDAYGSSALRDRWLFCGIPCAIVAAAVILGPEPPRHGIAVWLRLGGDASYALYLSHLFSINALVIVWTKLHLHGAWPFLVAAFILANVVAVIVYQSIERPLIRLLRARFERNESVSRSVT